MAKPSVDMLGLGAGAQLADTDDGMSSVTSLERASRQQVLNDITDAAWREAQDTGAVIEDLHLCSDGSLRPVGWQGVLSTPNGTLVR